MPRRPKPPTFTSPEDRVAATVAEEMDRVAARVAASQGDAPGTQKKGDTELVKLWGTRDPQVVPELLRQALQTTGLGDEAQQMAIVEEWPELAELYAQPVGDPVLLEQLLILAEFPFRRSVYEDIDDPEEQVKEAERIHGLWLKQQPALPLAPPVPAVPAPHPMPEMPMEPEMPTEAPSMAPMLGG